MSEFDELLDGFAEDAELTEPGGAKPGAGSVMPPGSRRDTDARRADLGARSLDVPGSVSSAKIIKTPKDVPPALERIAVFPGGRTLGGPDPKPGKRK